MGHSNTTLYAPIDVVGDLAYILGSSSSDIGTLIKQEGTINPWAKYKPFRSSAEGLVARDTFASFGFGEKPPQISSGSGSSLNAFVTKATGTDNGWTYLRPRGASYSEKFRLLDFAKVVKENGVPVLKTGSNQIGYNSAQPNPFGPFAMSKASYTIGDSMWGGQTLNTQIGDSGIAIKDMAEVPTVSGTFAGQMNYYGIALVNQGTGNSYLYFSNNIIKDGTRLAEPMAVPSFALNTSNCEAGTFKAYPFMTTAVPPAAGYSKITSKTAQLAYNMITVPATSGIGTTITITGLDITVTINYTVTTSGNTMTVLTDITVSQNGTSDIPVSDVYVKYRFSSNAYNDALQLGEEANAKTLTAIPGSPLSAFVTDNQSGLPQTIDTLWFGLIYNGNTYTWSKRITISPV